MKQYIPVLYYKNIYEINYQKLKQENIKNLLFDLDNTIIGANKRNVNEHVKKLFHTLKQDGFTIIIFSNSPKRRVRIFEKALHVKSNAFSCKPFSFGFKKICKKYHFIKKETAIIGDQILTDIKGGNRFGIMTILVTPIADKDFILTRLNRYHENKIIKKLEKKGLWKSGVYND